MSELSAITLESVSRFEKGVTSPLLKSIKADLKKGQLIAVVGADGAGKTTLMRVMAGLLKPQEGAVKLPRGGCQTIWREALFKRVVAPANVMRLHAPAVWSLY